ncbi:hypothetical protein K438DRAFT_1986709 [Mycena galopus ATCC 62051]|nr:hypothetical protein K438DRAFT_1986709 [Mycena galopus ATCC 62051]
MRLSAREAADDIQEWDVIEQEQFAAAIARDHISFAALFTGTPWTEQGPTFNPPATTWGTTEWVPDGEGLGRNEFGGRRWVGFRIPRQGASPTQWGSPSGQRASAICGDIATAQTPLAEAVLHKSD